MLFVSGWLAVLLSITVLTVNNHIQSYSLAQRPVLCLAMGNANARISRAGLSWLLKIAIGSDRKTVIEAQLGSPYCYLAARRHQDAVAYPAAWDPSVWIVLFYQGDRYQGYDISYGNAQP